MSEIRCMADALAIYRTLDLAEERRQFEIYAPFVRMPEYRLDKGPSGFYDHGDSEDAFNGWLAAKIALKAKERK